jgi:hypothetical protein
MLSTLGLWIQAGADQRLGGGGHCKMFKNILKIYLF